MTRRYRIIAAHRLYDGTAALWRTSTVRQRASWGAGAAITVLKIAPQNHGIIALAAGAWTVAAWRAGAPSRPEEAPTPDPPPGPLTSTGSAEGDTPESGGVAGKTDTTEGGSTFETAQGTATSTPDPHRTNVTWKRPA